MNFYVCVCMCVYVCVSTRSLHPQVILSALLVTVQAGTTQDSEVHNTASPGHGEEPEGHLELSVEEQTDIQPELGPGDDSELGEKERGSELLLESSTHGFLVEPSDFLLVEPPELSQGYSAPGVITEDSDHLSQVSQTHSSPGTHVELSSSKQHGSDGVSNHYPDSIHDLSSYYIHDLSSPSSHSLSHGYRNSHYGQECGDGQVTHVDGSCVTPSVTRRVYVFEAPKLPRHPTPPPLLPPPRIVKNILYVRTPEEPPPPPPLILPPIEKNIVYILNKQREVEQKIIEAPVRQEETPEVYFVDYAAHDNLNLPSGGDLRSALALTSLDSSEESEEEEEYGKED